MTQKITKLLILLLVVTRILFLNSFPISLNWDEVSHGYNAYSILHTSYDQWGKKLPMFNFRAYGDYPTTLNMYASIPFISIFGLNSFSIRIFSAIMGILIVLSVYKLSDFLKLRHRNLFFLILLFSNTLFFTSRGVFQSTVASGLYFLGLYLILSKSKYNWFGLLSLTFSQYAYHNARIVTPFVLIFLFIKGKEYIQKIPIFVILISIIFSIFSINNLLTNKDASARNKWVSIVGIEATNQIIVNRQNFSGPPQLNRILNNKLTYAVKAISKNYLWYISPYPLFFQGTGNYQFNLPHLGLWPTVALPFFYFGLFFVLKNRKKYQFFLFFIIIGFLPAAITQGDFPVLRLSLVLPLYAVLISMGVEQVSRRIFWIVPIFVFVYSIQFLQFARDYFTNYPFAYADTWQYGYKQIVDISKENYSRYSNIVVTKKYGEPHEFFLFYWPWNPIQYLLDPKKKTDMHSDWYWVDSFDKFHFVNDWDLQKYVQNTPGKKLVFSSQNNLSGSLMGIIRYPNQDPVFYVYNYEN